MQYEPTNLVCTAMIVYCMELREAGDLDPMIY
jgi:hypothetical protein